jgi:hypothetical protein
VVAIYESAVPDTYNAIRNRYIGKSPAVIKSIASDVCDTVWDRDIGKAETIIERTASDTGDRQAIDRAWYCSCTFRAVESRNCDCAVIGRVSELRPHRKRHRAQDKQERYCDE